MEALVFPLRGGQLAPGPLELLLDLPELPSPHFHHEVPFHGVPGPESLLCLLHHLMHLPDGRALQEGSLEGGALSLGGLEFLVALAEGLLVVHHLALQGGHLALQDGVAEGEGVARAGR